MVTNFTSSLAERALPESVDAIAQLDADISAQYMAMTPKGLVTAIKLGDCDPYDIRNAGHIGRFVVALYDLIEMRRFDDPIIVRCGADLRVYGYSLAQLIETSLISGHFAEASNNASLNIFSCKLYPPYRAAAFCRSWFGATTVRVSVTLRQAAERDTGTLGRTAMQQVVRDAYSRP
jgi:hypothetical protein